MGHPDQPQGIHCDVALAGRTSNFSRGSLLGSILALSASISAWSWASSSATFCLAASTDLVGSLDVAGFIHAAAHVAHGGRGSAQGAGAEHLASE